MRMYRSGTSEAYIGNSNQYVLKKRRFEKYPGCDCLTRELYWLQELKDFDRVPKVLDTFANGYVLLTFIGERISQYNIPSDWGIQMAHILTTLKKYKCCHNDIKPDDILILNGKINLTDFGWATRTDEPIPSNWPKCINDLVRKPNEPFDDARSFDRSIKLVLSGEKYRSSPCIDT